MSPSGGRNSGDPAVDLPRLVVDADAAPFKEDMLELAAQARVEVFLVCSPRHVMPEAPHVRLVQVDHEQPDAADFAVANHARRGDIVVTQDAGLAAMVLSRGVRVLSTRGFWYTPESVDRALNRRHEIRKVRRQGRLPKGRALPALTDEDRRRFRAALAEALGIGP